MPFQSEKQRRFLHANHPEIAKRWEKEYANGGILDINASEEIISDDGNDIELTAYNAAFDDPKDLSTGVKTLFQAKDGGRIGYAQGWSPGVAAEERAAEKSSGGGQYHGGGADVMAVQSVGHPTGDAEVASQIAADDRQRKQELKDLVATGPGSAEEKYSDYSAEDAGDLGGYTETKRNQLYSARTRTELAEAKRIQLAKIKKMGKAKLIPAVLMFIASGGNISLAMKTFTMSKKDMIDVVRHSLPVMKAKKEHLKALDEYKTALLGQVDILNPNEMKSKIGTNISDITNEINDLTKTPEDDTKGDGPKLPQVVPIGKEIEEYEGTYAMSPWERIKANQAKRAMLVEQGIIQDSPIVDESVTDITMEANSGGLANLFRVKNQ